MEWVPNLAPPGKGLVVETYAHKVQRSYKAPTLARFFVLRKTFAPLLSGRGRKARPWGVGMAKVLPLVPRGLMGYAWHDSPEH